MESFIASADFSKYSLVIVCGSLSQADLFTLESILISFEIPLVMCKAFGFIGYLRLSLGEYAVVETHPENQQDLRLDCPWPELVEHASSYDLDSVDVSHIPYVVLILKAIQMWKQLVYFLHHFSCAVILSTIIQSC